MPTQKDVANAAGVGYIFLAIFNPSFAFNINLIISSLIVALSSMAVFFLATPAPAREIVDI